MAGWIFAYEREKIMHEKKQLRYPIIHRKYGPTVVAKGKGKIAENILEQAKLMMYRFMKTQTLFNC